MPSAEGTVTQHWQGGQAEADAGNGNHRLCTRRARTAAWETRRGLIWETSSVSVFHASLEETSSLQAQVAPLSLIKLRIVSQTLKINANQPPSKPTTLVSPLQRQPLPTCSGGLPRPGLRRSPTLQRQEEPACQGVSGSELQVICSRGNTLFTCCPPQVPKKSCSKSLSL